MSDTSELCPECGGVRAFFGSWWDCESCSASGKVTTSERTIKLNAEQTAHLRERLASVASPLPPPAEGPGPSERIVAHTDRVLATAEAAAAFDAMTNAPARIAALEQQLADARKRVAEAEELASDLADDHSHLQLLCRLAGIPERQLAGDSHGVPGIGDLADMLAARLAEAEGLLMRVMNDCRCLHKEQQGACAACRAAAAFLANNPEARSDE